MKKVVQVPDSMKLRVKYRIEPGCLGPDGANKVVGFCEYCQQEIQSLAADFVRWEIVPRYDKSLPEMEFTIAGRKMTDVQAGKYFERLNKSFDDFEYDLTVRLSMLIDTYMGY